MEAIRRRLQAEQLRIFCSSRSALDDADIYRRPRARDSRRRPGGELRPLAVPLTCGNVLVRARIARKHQRCGSPSVSISFSSQYVVFRWRVRAQVAETVEGSQVSLLFTRVVYLTRFIQTLVSWLVCAGLEICLRPSEPTLQAPVSCELVHISCKSQSDRAGLRQKCDWIITHECWKDLTNLRDLIAEGGEDQLPNYVQFIV